MSTFSRRRLLRVAFVALAAAPLGACGKRGALQAPYTPEEEALEARRAAGDTTAPRPKARKATPIKGPLKETPFDFLL